ncbi:MAG: AAA family ATPase [Ilumatobacteraceae bacterium]
MPAPGRSAGLRCHTRSVGSPADGHPVALPPLPPPSLLRAEGTGPRRARLRDAVRSGREGQAYLFSGPRGTGKTTSARILAKVLNCENPVEGEPCCECASCLAVEAGSSYDVHELDAASNNGVDAMRELIERASLGTPGRHKVYILDEVHMLSRAAEAALLKTLEEPPNHVVFVLATTDPQKVSDTIRSRTQHLRFRLLPADTLGRARALGRHRRRTRRQRSRHRPGRHAGCRVGAMRCRRSS